MTIKELCSKHRLCYDCLFNKVCPYYGYDFFKPLDEVDDETNEIFTRSIIDTAKLLTGDNINGNKDKENL